MYSYLSGTEKVCCQGILGAYSHLAARKVFGDIAPHFVKTFGDVFSAVESGEMQAGVLPLENSSAGPVGEVFDLLSRFSLKICHAVTLEIKHNLCALPGTKLADIKKIYSHHQALMQCSNFLGAMEAEQVETANTALSAMQAARERGSAAVCSAEAGAIYNLITVKADINNNANNETKFAVISKQRAVNRYADHTALYFKLQNKSGTLFSVLKVFSEYGINMTSLHSLPLKEKMWDYGFICEIDGNPHADKNVYECLHSLKKEVPHIILGTYAVQI